MSVFECDSDYDKPRSVRAIVKDEVAQQLLDTGAAMTKAVAEMYRTAEEQHRIVYLLWQDHVGDEAPLLLGVCGTLVRAKQEADDLGKALGCELRIEARQVHV